MSQVEQSLELDAPAARELLEHDENAVLVDVRGEDEWAGGYIPGAVLVPLRDLAGADRRRRARPLAERRPLLRGRRTLASRRAGAARARL